MDFRNSSSCLCVCNLLCPSLQNFKHIMKFEETSYKYFVSELYPKARLMFPFPNTSSNNGADTLLVTTN